MTWLDFLPEGLFFAASLTTLATFDALVRLEYRDHVDAWLADGRPRGLAQPLPGSAPEMSPVWGAFWRWTFRTPTWARADVRARRLLLAYRLAYLLATCAWIAMFAKIAT